MSLPEPYYHDEKYGLTIYHGDCREILPELPKVDLVLTDPPYGIDYDPKMYSKWDGSDNEWDKIVNDLEMIDYHFLFSLDSRTKVVFGAENILSFVPHRGRWICWDKKLYEKNDSSIGSPFEIAWVDVNTGFYKMYRVLHNGVVNADSVRGNNQKRFHPTQKPVKLFRSIIQDFSKDGTILDPFMGSGTTLVAAKQLGRKAIGIEIEEKYCEIAVKRLRQDVLEFAG